MKRYFSYIIFFIQVCVYPGFTSAQTIVTIAGTGTPGFSGDGGPATAAAIHNSLYGGVTIDGSGNKYISDYGNSLIRKVSPSGVISTFAGVYGYAGTSGDGGPATSALIAGPIGIFADGPGNVYITGYSTHIIRKVNTSGIISTVAGTGTAGYSGDGGPATAAQLNQAWGVCADHLGNIYIADNDNHVIRKVDNSGIITTFAGTGVSGYSGDGGPATAAQLRNPVGIAVDRYRSVFIADLNDGRVRRVDSNGTITTVAGNGIGGFSGDGGPATSAQLYNSSGVAVDSFGNFWIADSYNNRIRKVSALGIITTVAGTGPTGSGTGTFGGDGGVATAANLHYPYSVAVDAFGALYISDNYNERIRMVAGNDRPPVFTAGASTITYICSGLHDTISASLVVHDSDIGQTITWGLISGPAHGTVSATYSTISTGTLLLPGPIVYTSASGYSGTDTFLVGVTDGALSDTIAIYVNVRPTPGTISGAGVVCAGYTITLADTTAGGTWTSSAPSVATIGSSSGIVTGISGGSTSITYTNTFGCIATTAVTVTSTVPVITGLSTVCTALSIGLSASVGGGTWTSASPSIATVGSGTGVVTGVSVGFTTITYSAGGSCIATRAVTVNLSPAPVTGIMSVCAGTTTTLSDATTGGLWSSTNTALAMVGSSSGLVTTFSYGLDTIRYTISNGCFSMAMVTINAIPIISPFTKVYLGGTTTLTCYSGPGAWTSTAPSVATVGSFTGVVTGISLGTATISVLSAGCYGSIVVNVVPPSSVPDIIKSVAGTGSSGFSGDGAAATVAQLSLPYDVFADALGNLYIADNNNNRIRKVSGGGIISTIAGTGTSGYSGDGGPATAAMINHPAAVFADGAGNVYFTDKDNNRVRCISSSGIITTIAGNGTSGYSGDGSAATAAQVNGPFGISGDPAGNIYFADHGNQRIRMINTSGVISTVAGNGTIGYLGDGGAATACRLNFPKHIYADAVGCIYIADNANQRIRRVDPYGIITTFAGNGTIGYLGDGGAATTARLNNPYGISLDAFGNCYIADQGNHRVRKVSSAGIISTITGTGTMGYIGDGCVATAARLNLPTNVCSAGSLGLYIADQSNHSIRRITADKPPRFLLGHHQSTAICSGDVLSLNLFLAVIDSDANTSLTWATVSAPSHGALVAASTVSSVIGVVSPTGVSYTPAGGYSGPDSFRVRVTDCAGLSDTTTIVVTVNAIPSAITGTGTICTGVSITLSDASPGGTWTSGTPSVAVVGSSSGMVTGLSAGTTYITYTLPTGCTAYAAVTVVNPPLPITGTTTTCIGSTTFLFDPGGGTWTSGTSSVATIGSSSGVVTGVSAGSSMITYSVGIGCSTTTPITVYPVPAPITGTASICTGSTTALADAVAGGYWTSGTTTVATVGSASGIVTGLSGGTTTITYAVAPGTLCASVRTVTVNMLPLPVSGMPHTCVGSTTTLTDFGGGTWSGGSGVASVGSATGIVTGLSAGTTSITYTLPTGCAITAPVTVDPLPAPISGSTHLCVLTTTTFSDPGGGSWMSSDPLTLDIDPSTGSAFALTAGTSVITYTLPTGCYSTRPVTVDMAPAPISGMPGICLGSTTTFTDATSGGTWSSSSPAIASVGSLSGLVSGLTTGSATITYYLGVGCVATQVVTVNPVPTPILGLSSVCVGASATMVNGVSGGSWTTTSTLVSIGLATGIVTGLGSGVATITYTLPGGCRVTKALTVNSSPAPISGTSTVCVGTGITFTDATTGGVWSSSSTSFAVVGSSSGYVMGISPGAVTIVYTALTGCSSSMPVSVVPPPAAITGALSLCVGAVTTLADATPGGVWSSSTAGATVGSASGIVSGVSAGVATITYTAATGCYRTASVTVNALPAPIGGPSAVCVGASITLTDAGGGTWVSSTPSVATIGSSSGVVTGAATGTTLISYTLPAGCRTTRVVTVSPSPGPILGTPTVCTGSASVYSDIVPGGLWSSPSSTVTVGSLTGSVSGVAAGVAILSYSLGAGCIVSRTVTVNLSPSSISGSPFMCTGTTVTLSDITPGGSWSSTIPGALIGTGSGVVTCVAAGSGLISYTLSSTGCSAILPVTISPTPSPIAALSAVCIGAVTTATDATPGGLWTSSAPGIVSIGSATGFITGMAAGTALVTYAIGATSGFAGCYATRPVTVTPTAVISGATGMCVGTSSALSASLPGGSWSSSAPAIASVGSSGVVAGIAFGTATITYTSLTGCASLVTVTVNSGPAPIGGSLHVCAGSATLVMDAVGGGTWTSASGTIATIGSSSGLATGIAAGTSVITYSLGTGCTTTAVLTVDPLPSAVSGSPGLCVGSSIPLTDITPGGSWTSSDPSVGVVGSASGIVTGISSGTAAISYTLPTGCAAVKAITVNAGPGPVTGSLSVCLGTTTMLTDAAGGGIWSSSAPGIAIIGSATGALTALATGTSVIAYTTGAGCTVTAIVTVNPVPVGITGIGSVCTGSTTVLADATTGGSWSSGVPAVAGVGPTGIVSGLSAGVAAISYMLPTGCYALRNVTVNALPGTITGLASVCVGSATALADAVPGGVWSSGASSVATVGSSGVVTGVSAGITPISYTTGSGCTATRLVTVIALPAPVAGPASVCIGAAITLTDATSGGGWSSGSPSVATVGASSGTVSGVTAGTAAISYTSVSGCSSIQVVTVHPLPAAITGSGNACIGTSTPLSDSTPGGTWSSSNPAVATIGSTSGLVFGVSVGTSAITYASAAGCRSSRTITVNPLPPGISGSANVCVGQVITLTDPDAGGTWSSSNSATAIVGSLSGIVSGVSGGSVVISYTMPTGCSAVHTVSVTAVPPVTGVTNMCAWGGVMMVNDANPAGSYSSTLVTVLNLGAGNGKVTSGAPGVASLTYTLSTGCYTTVTFTVNPLPLPVTGIMHACSGATTTLHEASPGGSWSSGSPAIATVGSATGIVTGIAAGNAHITYTLPTGCRIDTVVHIDASPATITVMSGTVIIGGTDLFTDMTPGGIWTSGSPSIAAIGSSTGVVTGISLGVATITYTLGSGCPATRTVTVVPLVSVYPDGPGVGIYPNPNRGSFSVRSFVGNQPLTTANAPGDVWLELTDMAGRVLFRRKARDNNGYIDEDISLGGDIANGMYVLSLITPTRSLYYHIAVSR